MSLSHDAVIRHAGGLHAVQIELAPHARVCGHRHDQPTLVLVTAGTLIVRDLAGVRVLGPDSVDLVPAGRTRAFSAGAAGVRCFVITADPHHAVGRHAAWHAAWHAAPPSRGMPDRRRALVAPLRRALAARDSTTPALEDAMLAFLRAASREEGPRRRATWLDSALARLAALPANGGSLRTVARDLRLHPGHLARVVNAERGFTVREHRRRVRIEQAIGMLRARDATLSTTAHRAGFADHAHLCRELAWRLGVTPSRLRVLLRRSDVASIQAGTFPGVQVGRVSPARVRADPA
ncbi:MAG: helix-turn-helix transcriptional regulator [Gemmatimonadetes bacterium]|nr:helix-turn-helix transcriptional regulator [Gemmatimonadota bacterium]